MAATHPTHSGASDPPSASPDPGWGRIAPIAGYVCGVSLLVATLLWLADVTELLAERPTFVETSAGYEADIAVWFVDYFERQREILWSILVRDTLFPLSFLALMVLALATGALVGWRVPAAQLGALLFVVGGTLHIVNDLMFLGQVYYWRFGGWSADPAGPLVAAGHASDAIGVATTYLEVGSYVILAGALTCLGYLCRGPSVLPAWLGVAAYAEAAGMLLLALGDVLGAQLVFQVGGFATGVILGPLVAIALGRHVGLAVPSAQPTRG